MTVQDITTRVALLGGVYASRATSMLRSTEVVGAYLTTRELVLDDRPDRTQWILIHVEVRR